MKKIIDNSILVLFVGGMFLIVCLLLFIENSISYAGKHIFAYSNIILFCIGIFMIGLLVGLSVLCRRLEKNKGIIFLERHSANAILILSVIVFIAQVFVCYNVYFGTGWDVELILANADLLAAGQELASYDYFSQYPNNVLLLFVFTVVKKIHRAIGILDAAEGIMGIVVLQCLFSVLTGGMLYQIVKKWLGVAWAWGAWFLYLLLLGTSGWLMIPYTDSLGLLLPISIFYLYQLTENKRFLLLKWFLLGHIACWGYHLKPQIIIVFVAILLVQLFCLFEKRSTEDKESRRQSMGRSRNCAVSVMAGVFSAALLYALLLQQMDLKLDQEKAFGVSHFVMMGLNSVSNGGYNGEDVLYSGAFATVQEREAANWQRVEERLQGMGADGLAWHLLRKTLMNYGDGTFFWGQEGNFYKSVFEVKNTTVSPFLRNFFYGGSTSSLYYDTIKQAVWLIVLFLSLGMIGYRKQLQNTTLVVLLALMGITAFVLLFEGRSRYLYIYVPFYIMAGILGAKRMVDGAEKALAPR